MNILFWNIQKKNLSQDLLALCQKLNTQILILAESDIREKELLAFFEKGNYKMYASQFSTCPKIAIYTRFQDTKNPIIEHNRWTIRNMQVADTSFLLVALHMISKNHLTNVEDDQYEMCRKLVEDIKFAEKKVAHHKTIVIGDFNMNPFEKGMLRVKGLHTTMDRRIALKQRTVNGELFPYFYNPMWNFLGDDSRGKVCGTHYYRNSGYQSLDWNMFDQVLLRSDLLPNFVIDSLEIITENNGQSFLHNGRPNKKNFSDHLPISITLHFS